MGQEFFDTAIMPPWKSLFDLQTHFSMAIPSLTFWVPDLSLELFLSSTILTQRSKSIANKSISGTFSSSTTSTRRSKWNYFEAMLFVFPSSAVSIEKVDDCYVTLTNMAEVRTWRNHLKYLEKNFFQMLIKIFPLSVMSQLAAAVDCRWIEIETNLKF